MAWEKSDDDKIDNCIDRLETEDKKLHKQLSKINILRHGARQIQAKKRVIQKAGKADIEIILPLDLSGEPMKDEYRLEQLGQIITKTDELLGPEEVQDE